MQQIETLLQEKKAGYIHSNHARKEGGRKNPEQNIVTTQRRQNSPKYVITPPTQTPE
jgi:hypothetical protein